MKGLCFRCEHRAKYLEEKWQPRYECGQVEMSVYSCYMFQPVKPVVVEKSDKKDRRPALAAPIISARINAVRLPGGELAVRKVKGGIVVFWEKFK